MLGHTASKVLGSLADAKHSAPTFLTLASDQRSQYHGDFDFCEDLSAVNLALTLSYMSANITTAYAIRISTSIPNQYPLPSPYLVPSREN